jgi:SAM-dependent methyltransferase
MSEQMSDSLSAEEIMERIRERVRLRKQAGNGNAMTDPAASVPVSQERAAALSLYDLSEMRRNAAASNMLRDQVGRINARHPGLPNDLFQLLKKALRRMLTWYTRPLQEFHASVTRTLNETARAVENLQQNVTATVRRLDAAKTLQGQLIRDLGDRLDRIEQLHTRRREERLRLNERDFRRVAYMPSESEFDYFLFEERFRGSEADIKNRQHRYVDIFRGRENVVDLGCGRGEFLELMRENGVSARGVESNTAMFQLCREKGLNVVQQSLFDYLESVPAGSVGGIFCSQVIEHLPSGLQIRLVALSHSKLKPGSPVVIETINPQCLFALSRNFFLDPTHVRPVHPEMLQFLLESTHFEKVELQFSSPANLWHSIPNLRLPQVWPDLDRLNQVLEQMNALLFGDQDYAVVGYR